MSAVYNFVIEYTQAVIHIVNSHIGCNYVPA